ncbi:MAG: hypothetical protein J1F67_06065 [Muribaculaceae bacterium]|nr:hypothetical protein [Muribaculaceae bacterium]
MFRGRQTACAKRNDVTSQSGARWEAKQSTQSVKPQWFKNTEVTTLAKNLRNTRGCRNIEIDTNILDKI